MWGQGKYECNIGATPNIYMVLREYMQLSSCISLTFILGIYFHQTEWILLWFSIWSYSNSSVGFLQTEVDATC
jgi:hypothetical protein